MNLCISAIFALIYLLLQNGRNFAKGIEYKAENHKITQNKNKSTPKLITVDVTKQRSNDQYRYEYKFYKLSHTFIAEPGHLIEKVTFQDSVLWDSKDYGNCYSNQVFVGRDEKGKKVFRIYFPTDAPKICATFLPEPVKDYETVEGRESESKYEKLHESIPPKPKRRQSVYYPLLNRLYQPSTGPQTFQDPESYYEMGPGREMKPEEKLKAELGPESESAGGIDIQHIRSILKDIQRKIGSVTPPIPEPKTESTKPKLVTLEVKNKKSTEEIDYEYDEKHRTHTFTPNKGYLIHDVTRKGKVMWECENGVYPERVLIFLDANGEPALRLQFPGDVPSQTQPQIPESEPEPLLEPDHTSRVRDTFQLPGSGTDATEFFSPRRTEETMRHAQSDPESFFKPIHTHLSDSRERIVHLDSDRVMPHKRTLRPEPRIRVSVPPPKPEPDKDTEPIYRSDLIDSVAEPQHTPEKPTVVPSTYKSGEFVYSKDPARLFLDFTKRTDVFKYDTHVSNHIYTPTTPHIFNKVSILNPHPLATLDIWETETPEEFAYRVEQFGFHHVLIYSNNGNYVLFDRDDNDNWTRHDFPKVKGAPISSLRLEHKVAKFDDEGKVDSAVLLKKLIQVDIARKFNTFMSEYTKEGNVYTFRPGEGYVISAVMDSSSDTYLGQHDVTEDMLTLKLLDGSTKTFKRVGKKWLDFMFDHTVDNTKKLPFVLNLSTQSRFATYEFETDIENKTMMCTVKEGYAIKEVAWLESEYQFFRHDKKVWSTEDPLYFARRVFVKNLGLGEKVITIDMFNGLQLTFRRSIWGVKWDFMGSKVIRGQ
ncbi:uncharacterized protein TOT_020000856 [Theileria orientalis strain Shintoku]|uniref:SfiI-subtelomeric related protein family member n=1 Tax=Theileria orientalis strain Shintoku TaxID=869250 RepID=J4C3K5_THEOR|nr:uncharacterized protein TOT_020000856 [Theileria orientalis strain Shintoku]BAM40601.1 uncharacterized protein TOT_020000856 [Theileria orientalis strain Shintoku]|eukprot:XP_009690902.1 uncharacterized protein TOT_020000856 [Theileria orientalis strain Shintoku]